MRKIVSLTLAFLIVAAFFVPRASASPPVIGREVGQAYPDFLLPDLAGGTGRLSDYRGKKVLLFHFASW